MCVRVCACVCVLCHKFTMVVVVFFVVFFLNSCFYCLFAFLFGWAPSGVRTRLTRGRSEIDPCQVVSRDFSNVSDADITGI